MADGMIMFHLVVQLGETSLVRIVIVVSFEDTSNGRTAQRFERFSSSGQRPSAPTSDME